MAEMIKKVIQYDEEKRKENQQLKIHAETEKELTDRTSESIYNSILEDAKNTVKNELDKTEKSAQVKLENSVSKHNAAQVLLETEYKENKDKWSDEIFNNII